MNEGSLLLAMTAGLLAAVNPCGFAMLPAYLSLFVLDDTTGRGQAVRRALTATAAMTLGFVAVFGLFGLVIAPFASGIQRHLPWVTLVAGVLLIAAGSWLLSGRSLPALGWSPGTGSVRRSFISILCFGAVYAIASLTCTIAPFLAVVVSSFRTGSTVDGIALYLAYAAGMGLLVGTAALAVALARESLITRLRKTSALVPKIVAILLLLTGGYVAYYGWWEITVLNGQAAGPNVLISVAAQVQGRLSAVVSTLGVAGVAVLFTAAVVVVGLTVRLRRRHNAAHGTPAP